jgi:hypothetical protein
MKRAILAMAVMACASWVSADEIWLKGGGRIVGEILERTPKMVKVDVGPGTVTMPMERVDRIVGSASRLEEFRSRAARLGPQDRNGWIALATWAEQNDLNTQARGAWLQVLAIEPESAIAHQALGDVRLGGRWLGHDEAMRAQGLIECDGQWISPAACTERSRAEVAEAASRREAAIADARVAEAEARAREAEARARAAEAEATRADDYSDDGGGIPLIGYGAVGYGGSVVGFPVSPCGHHGHGSHCPDNPPVQPPVVSPPRPPQRDRNPQPSARPAARANSGNRDRN